MKPKLFVIVDKGDPVDLQRARHAALFISENDQEVGNILNVTGDAGFFKFERRQHVNPTQSKNFVKKVPVGPISNNPTTQQLIARISATPIDNSTHSWNCQNWVGDALIILAQEHWISAQSKSDAIDSMAEVIVEAEDEEL